MQDNFTIIYAEEDWSTRQWFKRELGSFFPQAEILLAEDFRETEKFVEDAVKADKHIVVVADAYHYLLRSDRDVDLIQHVHKKYPAIPCVYYAGPTDRSVRARCLEMGIPYVDSMGRDYLLDLALAIEAAEPNGPGSGHYASQQEMVRRRLQPARRDIRLERT